MPTFCFLILNIFRRYVKLKYMFVEIFKGKKVAVAVSGGIDSVVLLDRLVKETKGLDVTLSVVNVDHCIREESASDSLFVKELAAFYGLPFFPFKVDALTYAEENGLSEETAARVLRYDCFEKVDCDYIALAHHMSDQAESILMHILRGSGSKGAVGMRRVNGRYVRPLLDTPKEDIERYAAEKGCTPAQIALAWVMHDENVVPIPGMRSEARIAENLGAAEISLSGEEYAALTAELDKLKVYGVRTDDEIARLGELRKELYGGSGVPFK